MFAAVGIAVAVVSLAPVSDAEIEALCQQLGDPAYRVRDAANRKLRACGAAAHAKVLEHCADEDPEIELRCRHLLPALRFDAIVADDTGRFSRDLPGYDRYREIVGWDAPDRLLFARLDSHSYFLKARPSIEELAPWSRGAADGSVYQPQPIEVARYLFETDPNAGYDEQFLICAWLDPMLATSPEGAQLRKLLAARVAKHVESRNRMYLFFDRAERLGLKEIVPHLLARASNPSLDAANRAACLAAVARLGTREDLPALEKYFDDRTHVTDVLKGQSRTQRTFLCDVALAASARLAGIPFDAIGLPQLKPELGSRWASRCGFESEEARTEARARVKRALETK